MKELGRMPTANPMMKMESAQETLAATVRTLLAGKITLNLPDLRIDSLPEFLHRCQDQSLQPGEREIICEQAILILDQFYAHLPFKRARYGIDPIQRLRLLRSRIQNISHDLKFHTELIQIFTELRDAHTLYGLPAPYRGALAFLPFVVKCYTDDGLHFVVTQTLSGFEHPEFKPGIEITHWNGMAIARAVERLSSVIPAGNEASKFTRGMLRLTMRSLTYGLPPSEEAVFVQFRPDPNKAEEQVLLVPWSVATGFPEGAFRAPATAVCQPVADQALAMKAIWGERVWQEQEDLQRLEEAEAHERQQLGRAAIFSSLADAPESFRDPEVDFLYTKMPKVFEFQHPSGLILRQMITPDELVIPDAKSETPKRFGYLRIKTFEAHPDSLFDECKRILEVMNEFAPDGLIIDVRGNSGGSIKGAERILQMLTPLEITPAAFHFANTPMIQGILGKVATLGSSDPLVALKIRALQAEFGPWIEDAGDSIAEGLQLTEGRPLTSKRSANNTGQIYQGPAALVIDAVSYSATDIFSAGFQDHEIGEIIGVDENTGGGGASRWWHQDDLFERLEILPDMPLKPLPGGAVIAFASMRSTRVGRRAGQALEDLGVTRTVPYRLTKTDIMDWGSNLVQFACNRLATKPAYKLEITLATFREEGIDLDVRAKNLVRLVCYVNGVAQFSGSADLQRLSVPLDGLEPKSVRDVELKGYAWPDTGDLAGSLVLVVAARYRQPIGYAPAETEAE